MSSVMTMAIEPPLVVDMGSLLHVVSDDQFFEFCRLNRDLRIERTKEGDIIVMPPTGGKSGERNAELTFQLKLWARSDGTGAVFDSSTEFKLPNGANRSPDASWILLSRWDALTDDEKEKFPPICPDFVVELRSRTDSLAALHDKMKEYIDNGARLGWLIDPYARKVHIYRPNHETEVLDQPETVSGDPVLPGFVLDMTLFWD
jgi:Uma2 family endonuclease